MEPFSQNGREEPILFKTAPPLFPPSGPQPPILKLLQPR